MTALPDRPMEIVEDWYKGRDGKVEIELARRASEVMLRQYRREIISELSEIFLAWNDPLGNAVANAIQQRYPVGGK